ncbi:tRNA lysidine(34) synthetase TilS [Alkalibaculum sporogenes]|nr:tRNA lysidine(34) synthetase TilS [Alkalibaculum sporogenes]
MKDKVLDYIKQNEMFSSGDKVIVGVSGGVDSVALTHLLNDIKDQYQLSLIVCHLNHMIRGQEADEDELFVKNLCNVLELEFYSKRLDIVKLASSRKKSIEETGREERYKFFDEIRVKNKVDKIALGHHKDDNVETIFMRFIRGTGIKGLRGIAPKRADGVVRPLLCVSKKDVLEYVSENDLKSRFDRSNLETDYHRNKLRLEVIPYMESLNPNFSTGIVNLGFICENYYDFIQEHVRTTIELVTECGKINICEFIQLHEVLKTEILIELINKFDSASSIEHQHIKIILNKLKDNKSTVWTIDLPNGIKMIRQYNYLILDKEKEILKPESFRYELLLNKFYVLPKINLTINVIVVPTEKCNLTNKRNKGYFDYDKIIQEGDVIYLRSRVEGDKIEPVGLTGTKKIKDILIDKKIPANKRWKIPIISVDNKVVWIVGYHKSRKFTISNDTKKVLMISYFYHKEE